MDKTPDIILRIFIICCAMSMLIFSFHLILKCLPLHNFKKGIFIPITDYKGFFILFYSCYPETNINELKVYIEDQEYNIITQKFIGGLITMSYFVLVGEIPIRELVIKEKKKSFSPSSLPPIIINNGNFIKLPLVD